MRVIEIREHGAPEVLVSSTRPDPAVPTAGSGCPWPPRRRAGRGRRQTPTR